jgi:hypothetical protein
MPSRPAVTVRVENADNSLNTTSTDQVTLSIESGPGTFTGGSTLVVSAVGGIATFNNLHINTAGTYTLRATDTQTGSTLGFVISNSFNITPDAVTHLVFGVQPTNTVAGVSISPAVTVQLLDQFNNLTNSTANVTMAIGTNPGGGTLSGTLTVAAVGGVATFSNLSINKAGVGYTLTAASSGLTGATSAAFNITPAAAQSFTVAGYPSPTVAGVSHNFTVTAFDAFGNLATGYGGTVHFTSSDGLATLPANSTLSNGSGTFSATFNTGGTQSLTATDTVTASINGTQSGIVVLATTFEITAPASALAGSPFTITVRAKDPNGNTQTTYTGTVHFTSSDRAALLPANYLFTAADNGIHTFTNGVTLFTTTAQTITATDTVNASITGSATVGVATQHFDFNAAGTPTASGYSGVAPATLYNATSGYGWVGTAASPFDSGSPNALLRDGQYGTDNTFAVALPNGNTAEETNGERFGSTVLQYILPAERHFDFNLGASPTAAGYIGIMQTALYGFATGYGWQNATDGFDRGVPNNLLRDGNFGKDVTPGTFQVDLPAGTFAVTATVGDASFLRDFIDLRVGGSSVLGGNLINTAAGQFATRTFTFTVPGPANGQLGLQILDLGGNIFWVINSLDIRPLASVVPVSFTSGPGTVGADGLTVDTVNGTTNMPDGALLTVSSNLGTVVGSDADPNYAGVQVVVTGHNFSFNVQRPALSGIPTLSATTPHGLGPGHRQQRHGAAVPGLQRDPPLRLQRPEQFQRDRLHRRERHDPVRRGPGLRLELRGPVFRAHRPDAAAAGRPLRRAGRTGDVRGPGGGGHHVQPSGLRGRQLQRAG